MSSPFASIQGARDPVSKPPLIRRFPEDVQAVEAGVVDVLIVVDVVESKVLDFGEAAILVLVTE
jgi:hypothetical protein